MTDHSELKRLAEAALRNWPDSKLFERPECERFIDATRPDVVLALIAEVEGLRAQHGRDSAELRRLCQARYDARKERDQLKAENAELRKDAERINFIESKNHRTLRFYKKRWSFEGFTNYEYSVFKSLREAIDSAMGVKTK